MKRIHQTFQIAYGITLLLCGQKGRKTATMSRLSLPQRIYNQKCLSNTQCSNHFGQTSRIKIFYRNGRTTRIQQYLNSKTRSMERSIQDKSRIIQTNCHVLRNV